MRSSLLRRKSAEDLVFNVSYLGGDMPTLALNFSRPGAQVLLQYYLFLRLGFQGYKTVQQTTQDVAMSLAKHIGEMAPFSLLSDGSTIPVFAWQLNPGHTKNWTLYDLQQRLRAHGWLIPAYPLPDNLSDQVVQRIVVRNGMNMDLASNLLRDIHTEVTYLDSLSGPLPTPKSTSSYHH